MKSAFDSNVARRKPRTRLGTMLADLDDPGPIAPSDLPGPAAAPAQVSAATSVPIIAATLAPTAMITPTNGSASHALPASELRPIVIAEAELRRATQAAPGADAVKAGRERIQELKDRLKKAVKIETKPTPEPTFTADRVRDTVASLRHRLDRAATERAEIVAEKDLAQKALATSEHALESEKTKRQEAESLAEERSRVAEGLLLESEALAEERDQAVERIGEFKDLYAEQATLLGELEHTLADRERALNSAKQEAAELRGAFEAQAADADLLQERLDEREAEHQRLKAKVLGLEAELSRAATAREALSEIQRLVDAVN